jgi:hypothetical protein
LAQYRYTGPGPAEQPGTGALIHPGDVWEFPEPPAFGAWEPRGPEKPPDAPAVSSSAGGAESTPAGGSAPSSSKEA